MCRGALLGAERPRLSGIRAGREAGTRITPTNTATLTSWIIRTPPKRSDPFVSPRSRSCQHFGGHYFLTVLVPVITDCPIPDGPAYTSPVHALRTRLARLPPAQQTPACCDDQSPFARNTRNHFVRFAIIDDVAYNGRQHAPLLWTLIKNIDIMVARKQDHLTCPFLFFGADFDAASGTDAERDSYLVALSDTMQTELKEIFKFCVGFHPNVKRRRVVRQIYRARPNRDDDVLQ